MNKKNIKKLKNLLNTKKEFKFNGFDIMPLGIYLNARWNIEHNNEIIAKANFDGVLEFFQGYKEIKIDETTNKDKKKSKNLQKKMSKLNNELEYLINKI